MNDESFRVLDLGLQGFNCSQILVLMALEAQGKAVPELVRAMSGLLEGMGTGKTCGALTGGCCVLGLYAGKGSAEEHDDARLRLMLNQLGEWFETEHTRRFGGINCTDIIKDDAKLKMTVCPQVVMETFAKVKEILAANNYELSQTTRTAGP